MKKVILGFIIGIVVCGVASVSAITLLAKDIGYKDTNVEAAIDDLYVSLDNKSDLLWSNSDLLVAFPAQTINLDLSKYSKVLVTGMYHTGTAHRSGYVIVPVGGTGTLEAAWRFDINDVGYRSVSCTTTGCTFGEGRSYTEGNSDLNKYGIPTYIIGMK